MVNIRRSARRYGYRLRQKFREDPFSVIVLYALFFSAVFLIFAFRGLIASIFIRPLGIINPGSKSATESQVQTDTNTQTGDTITLEPAKDKTYIVKTGDTISIIAKAVNVDWKELADLNELKSPYSLSVGQELKLP